MKKNLKNFFASSTVLVMFASYASAVEITPFGKVGAIGNFAFGDNTINDKKLTGYMGVTGHLGVDFNFNGFRLGVGAMAGFAPLTLGTNGGYGSNAFVNVHTGIYKSPFIDASDLYVGYGTESIAFLFGRYNASKIISTADWLGGYNQGAVFSYKSENFGVWATWINDFLQNGYNANANLNIDGRYGMDLAGFNGYSSSWNNFNFNREVFAAGVNIMFGELFEFSPFAHYWLNKGDDYLQAGARMSFAFDVGLVKNRTTLRGLWTNNINSGHNGVMWQVDEELLFLDMIKLGGGYLSIGGIGLNGLSLIDRTRFYGQYLLPYGFSGTGLANRGYLLAASETYYVFTGFKLGSVVDLDILYANGDYKEFSTIINYNIIGGSTDDEGGESGITWSVGGGYVTDNFKSHTALVYTKLKF